VSFVAIESRGAATMNQDTLELMSLEDLWELHEKVAAVLSKRIAAEKVQMEERLRKIGAYSKAFSPSPDQQKRPYPAVVPKYKNPNNPAETWSGRGKQPRWLQEQLRSGKKLDRFLIAKQRSERK
jgi:DNA-binding protein H-NS